MESFIIIIPTYVYLANMPYAVLRTTHKIHFNA